MNDHGRRVNSIVIKNLPPNYNESQLESLFSKFGRIVSSKVLPSNPNYDGGCGFVNFADADSCIKAVENMNQVVVDRFTLRVHHSSTRLSSNGFDRLQQGSSSSSADLNENSNGTVSPSFQNRFNAFRSTQERSPINSTRVKTNNGTFHMNESETQPNINKPSWSSASAERQTIKTPVRNELTVDIREHESFVANKTYCVYLSNLEVPNTVFVATLDDYVSATLLITHMNKDEQLTKVRPNSYKLKLTVGQFCAALFNGDWYRARILQVDENQVYVQYIDWGNTGWCDSLLEIRHLPDEYYKDPILCTKCILDDVSTSTTLSEEQTNSILEILVLDVKLEMTVLRFENGVPYVELNLGKRNLNAEIRSLLTPQTDSTYICQDVDDCLTDFNSNKPEVKISEIHSVQLTTADTKSECFHVLLMRDCLATIMNTLKDWHASKQPLTKQPTANMLVCAQYEGDDLWYRAWIKSVSDNGYQIYFVDFGNEEIVPIDRLSGCPDVLRNIPWQNIQIQLANIKLTDEERFMLLREFEATPLNMKILSVNQDNYVVELTHNDKSLVDYVLELRSAKERQSKPTPMVNESIRSSAEMTQQPVSKVMAPPPLVDKHVQETVYEERNKASLPAQSATMETKPLAEVNPTKISTETPPISGVPLNLLKTDIKPTSVNDTSIDDIVADSLKTLVTEQRRQNRLLEQVIAAINTTNALLTQLVQR